MGILITGASAAAAFRIRRMLDLAEVIFADHLDLPLAIFKETRFLRIPEGTSSSFAHQLLKICLDNHIEIILPLRKDELLPLAEAKTLFEEYGIQVVVPEVQLLQTLPIRSESAGEFVIVSKGMILAGQFMELFHVPADTGIFSMNAENPSSAALYAID